MKSGPTSLGPWALAWWLVAGCGDGGRTSPVVLSASSVPLDGSASAAPSSSSATPSPTASAATSAVSPAIEKACASYAKARCDGLRRCSLWQFESTYADGDACVRVASKSCVVDMAPDASGATAATIEACAAALGSCEAVLGEPPSACRPKGKLATGKPCTRAAQCSGGFCERSVDARCGTCRDLPRDHDRCLNETLCDYGFACVQGSCLARVDRGEACGSSAMCKDGMRCVRHECAPAAAEHEACDATDQKAPACDRGLVCSPKTRKCERPKRAKLGEACSADKVCPGGTFCSQGLVCQHDAKDGDPCAPSGPFCEAPAACLGGVCSTLPDRCP